MFHVQDNCRNTYRNISLNDLVQYRVLTLPLNTQIEHILAISVSWNISYLSYDGFLEKKIVQVMIPPKIVSAWFPFNSCLVYRVNSENCNQNYFGTTLKYFIKRLYQDTSNTRK